MANILFILGYVCFLLVLPIDGKIDLSIAGVENKINIVTNYVSKFERRLELDIKRHTAANFEQSNSWSPKPGGEFSSSPMYSEIVKLSFESDIPISRVRFYENKIVIDYAIKDGPTLSKTLDKEGKELVGLSFQPGISSGEYGLFVERFDDSKYKNKGVSKIATFTLFSDFLLRSTLSV